MGNSLHHRGPDGLSSVVTDSFGCLHLMLKATDNPGPQPFVDSDGFVITSDARLNDLAGLRTKLAVGADVAESELILRAYRTWGEDCVKHLDGDFAFAIFDGKKLFCARDHLGVKPLYIGERKGVFAFASEADAVALILQAEINETRIADFLVYPLEHVDFVSTFYHGVDRLPPATCMVVDEKGRRHRCYWEIDGEREIRFLKDEDYVAAYRELLLTAVSERTQGEGPVASMLSGGVDSSTVVGCTLAERKGKSLTTFSTVSPPGEACQDSAFMEIMIDKLALNAVRATPEDARSLAGRLLASIDNIGEPFDNYMIQIMLINLLARDAGHKYLLDGVEGDMLHSLSVSYPATLLRMGQVSLALKETYHQWNNTFDRQVFLLFLYYLWLRRIGIPNWLSPLGLIKRRFLATGIFRRKFGETIIHPAFADRMQIRERLDEMDGRIYGRRPGLKEQHLRAIHHPAIAVALERYDRVGARFGIEPRHPLMDRKLVEFSAAVPWNQKVRHGWNKYLLRRAGEGLVPRQVSFRVGNDENGWRSTDALIAAVDPRLRERIFAAKNRLATYIRPDVLECGRGEQLLEMYGLAAWLNRVDACPAETRMAVNNQHNGMSDNTDQTPGRKPDKKS